MHIRHLSARTLAGLTGIPENKLSEIFGGKKISEKTIDRFARALKVSPSEAFRQIEQIRAEKRLKKQSAKEMSNFPLPQKEKKGAC